MKVSIIIPTYNVNAYLFECLESIKKLKSNVEAIIIDDCGNQDPKPIVEQFLGDKRFKFIKNEKNLGQGGSRNVGMKNISKETTHIYFLDPDDVLIPSAFDYEFDRLIIGTSSITCGFIHRYKNKEKFVGLTSAWKHSNGFPFAATASFWSTSSVFDFWMANYEDAPWTLKMYNTNPKFIVCKKVTYIYRQRLSSITNSKPSLRSVENYIINKEYCRENGSQHPWHFKYTRDWEKFFMLSRKDRKKIRNRMPAISKKTEIIIHIAILFQKITFFNKWNSLFSRRGYFK